MKLQLNPFNRANPMTLQDAAIVSTVASFAIWVLSFLANATIGQIRVDPVAFAFDAVKTYAVAWAGNFITLAGLEQLVKRVEKEE